MCMYSLPPLEESHCFVVTKLFLWERETLLVLRLSGESDREDNEVETLLDDSDSFMGSKTRDQTRTEPIIPCNTAKQRTLQIKDALGEDMEGHRLPRHKDNVTEGQAVQFNYGITLEASCCWTVKTREYSLRVERCQSANFATVQRICSVLRRRVLSVLCFL
jgi:hypothetical protein